MFISHHAWLNKYKAWIFGGVLFLLIPGFIAMFTPSFEGRHADPNTPKIRGKPISPADLASGRRAVIAEFYLTQGEIPRTAAFDKYLNEQSVYRVVLMRKAAKLGIHASDDEVIEQIRRLPARFRGTPDGKYGEGLLYLNNYGVSPSQFEQFIREELIIERLQMLVTSAAKVTPLDVQLAYTPRHEKMTVDLVEFTTTNTAPVAVTDDEARTFYAGKRNNRPNAELFRRPPVVKVRYVLFPTDDAEQPITVTDQDVTNFYERTQMKYADTNGVSPAFDAVKTKVRDDLLVVRAQRQAADKATQFSVKVAPPEQGAARPDFAKVAADLGWTVHETGFFGQTEQVPGVRASTRFNNEAFALMLQPDVPTSDPVEGNDGYYVLELVAQKKSEIPPFDDVKDRVVRLLMKERTLEAVRKHGQEELVKVKQSISGGKSFAAVCAALDLKPRTSEPFTFSDKSPVLPLTMPSIQELALSMPTNAVSEFLPTLDGGLFFNLKDRQPPDTASIRSNMVSFSAALLRQNRDALFTEWVRALFDQEQVTFGQARSQSQPAQEAEPETEPESAPAPANN